MKNRINIIMFAIAAIVSVSVTACQKTDGSGNANKANSNTTSNTAQAANASTPVAASTSAGTSGPLVDAYKALYTARKNKDVEGLKKLMAKDVLEFLTEIGKEEKKSLDDQLKELCEKPQAATAEARNEKIDGDHATVEYLAEDGKWLTMDFVKEGGIWKLTIPKADTEPPVGEKKPLGDDKEKK